MDKTNILGHMAYEEIYIYIYIYIYITCILRTAHVLEQVSAITKKVNFFARAVYPLTAPTRNTGPAGLSSSAKYSSSAYTPPKLSIEKLVQNSSGIILIYSKVGCEPHMRVHGV
jgi:hypothetical protein